jgi:hypothetical protein
MMQGVPPWHTPHEMQQISNFAHAAEGLIVLVVALLALREAVHGQRRPIWPWLVLSAGAMLALFLLWPHAGVPMSEQLEFIIEDVQQRQHVIIALLLILGGAAEVWQRRRNAAGYSRAVFPGVLIGIGLLFLIHKQHGDSAAVLKAQQIHIYLGALFSAAGALRLADIIRPRRWLRYSWPACLIVAAVMLFVYREPKGAFETTHPDHADAAGSIINAN